eukprot:COSAG06_NODE_98_length_24155_cov_29.681784_12_plen_343_part_00
MVFIAVVHVEVANAAGRAAGGAGAAAGVVAGLAATRMYFATVTTISTAACAGSAHNPGFLTSDDSFWDLSDVERRCDSVSEGGPFGLAATETMWYRLPTGTTMATAPPGHQHCNTDQTGWVSGWGNQNGQPDERFSTPADGSVSLGQPPVTRMVCFDDGPVVPTDGSMLWSIRRCRYPTQVQGVNCGGFEMWELPPTGTGGCSRAYCLEEACTSCARSDRCTAAAWSSAVGCTCIEGWGGELCNDWIANSDPCATVNCGSHGACRRQLSGGICICTNGYSGDRCEIDPPCCRVYLPSVSARYVYHDGPGCRAECCGTCNSGDNRAYCDAHDPGWDSYCDRNC